MIQLKDALQQMENRDHRGAPVPFHIQFCTCNEQTNEGGELIDLEGVVLASAVGTTARPASTRTPWENGSLNFYILESKQTRKAHLRLITQFNHQPVL